MIVGTYTLTYLSLPEGRGKLVLRHLDLNLDGRIDVEIKTRPKTTTHT